MRDRTFGARTGLRAALYTELTAVLGTAISAATAGPWWAGAAGGAAVGLLLFVVRVKRLTLGSGSGAQWGGCATSSTASTPLSSSTSTATDNRWECASTSTPW